MTNSRLYLVLLTVLAAFIIGFSTVESGSEFTMEELRTLYAGSPETWPKPTIDEGIEWEELGPLPTSPFRNDSLRALTELGKQLFFDPRLSVSNQISCSSCHDPDIAWQDGRRQALGHDHNQGARNTPSLLNIWAIEPLFWDGRSGTLEEQSLHPIVDPMEMNQDLESLPAKLQAIDTYEPLFEDAFDDSLVTLDRIAKALAQFQRTLVSRRSDFDKFVDGDKDALPDAALRGLHVFRTKARCMNCHNGPMFTDMDFHNLGLHFYGREREDLGRFNVTQDPKDIGKFRTPSLRDVDFTGPYTHTGLITDLEGMMNMYNAGMARPRPRPGLENDPNFPVTSELLKPLNLTRQEMDDLIAFMEAISAQPFLMRRP